MNRMLHAVPVSLVFVATATGVTSHVCAQQLWTVDDNAPADFSTVQAAVDASADGDVIVVAPGSYAAFQVAAKGVAILGSGTPPPTVGAPITLAQTSASQTVVLAHLKQVASAGLAAGLEVQGCSGPVRIQDCTLRGQDSPQASPGAGAAAIRVDASADVALASSTATGGTGRVLNAGTYPFFSHPYGGGHGLDLSSAQVALWQSSALAGLPSVSNTVHMLIGHAGGTGVRSDGSFLFASASAMYGGKGGSHSLSASYCFQAGGAGDCGDGGIGLHLLGAPSSVHVQQPDLRAGARGTTDCYWPYVDGLPGKALLREASASIARRVQGQQRTTSAPALVAGTTVVDVTVAGVPGDLVYLVVESATSFQYDAALHGAWHLSYPPAPPATPDAVIGPSGSVTFPIALPALGPGQEARTYFVQPYVVDVSQQVFAGTPRSITLTP